MHFSADAREKLDRLQRERIALLEGFDENRRGFLGLWLGLQCDPEDHSRRRMAPLKAEGWKWETGRLEGWLRL